jgi:hypothetical protein
MADDFLQAKSVDVPFATLGALVVAGAAGRWAAIRSALPIDAEFIQAVPMLAEGKLRLYFYHDSFKQVNSILAVPNVTAQFAVAVEAN